MNEQPYRIVAARPEGKRMEMFAATPETGWELVRRIAPHVPHDATWWVEVKETKPNGPPDHQAT